METAIVSLICIGLIVFGGMTLSRGFLISVDSTTSGLGEVSSRNEEIMRTELTTSGNVTMVAGHWQITLQNSGQTKLADFSKWDVIVQYYDDVGLYHVAWLPYTEGTLGDNQWKKIGIYLNYLNGESEVFEPNILNPGEQIVIQTQVDPPVGRGTTNLIVISTPNGIPASAVFYRN